VDASRRGCELSAIAEKNFAFKPPRLCRPGRSGLRCGHHFVFTNGQGALAAAKSVPTILMARPPVRSGRCERPRKCEATP